MQNPGGGYASYETINGPSITEWLNPAEVFGRIMVEYAYPECTTSVVTGLRLFQKYDSYRSADIEYVSPLTQRNGQGRRRIHPARPAQRRLVVRLVGDLLYLRGHVCPREPAPRGHDVRKQRAGAPRMRIPHQQAAGGRRLGRELQGRSTCSPSPANSARTPRHPRPRSSRRPGQLSPCSTPTTPTRPRSSARCS